MRERPTRRRSLATRPKITTKNISAQDLGLLHRLAGGATEDKRVHQILCDLYLLEDFKEFVQKTRRKLSIPADGLPKNDTIVINGTIYRSDIGKELKYGRSILKRIDKASAQYIFSKFYFTSNYLNDKSESSTLLNVIRSYLLFGEADGSDINIGNIAYDESQDFNSQIKLTFRSDIRIDELKRFLDKRWPLIQEYGKIINRGNSKKTKLVVSREFGRDVLIYDLYEQVKKKKQREKNKQYTTSILAMVVGRMLKKTYTKERIEKALERISKRVKMINQ